MACAPESQHSFNVKVTFCLIKMQRITWKHELAGEWCTLLGFSSKAWKLQPLYILITHSFPCCILLASKQWHLKMYITAGLQFSSSWKQKMPDYSTEGEHLQGATSWLSQRRWQKIWQLNKMPTNFLHYFRRNKAQNHQKDEACHSVLINAQGNTQRGNIPVH